MTWSSSVLARPGQGLPHTHTRGHGPTSAPKDVRLRSSRVILSGPACTQASRCWNRAPWRSDGQATAPLAPCWDVPGRRKPQGPPASRTRTLRSRKPEAAHSAWPHLKQRVTPARASTEGHRLRFGVDVNVGAPVEPVTAATLQAGSGQPARGLRSSGLCCELGSVSAGSGRGPGPSGAPAP